MDFRYTPVALLLAGAVSVAGKVTLTVTPGGASMDTEPRQYECYRAAGPVVIDGRLTEPTWKRAAWTDLFVDIEGDTRPRPTYATRAMMAWDDDSFYVAAELEEPDVWGRLTQRDVMIYNDPDFEVFLWPTHGRDWPEGGTPYYYEFEINALNTAMDMLLQRQGGRHSNERKHEVEWDIEGLQHAVQVDGTLNWPADTDVGWTLEVAFPWPALAEYAGETMVPPKDGDTWRINFSRVQRVRGSGATECDNWVWSPQGVVEMHIPDRWGHVTFRNTPVDGP